MTAVSSESTWLYEAIDVNIVPDLYVTWIVDLWEGDRNDPATEITRYIGVWRAEDLEEADGAAVDPTFRNEGSYRRVPRPSISPLIWETLETIKEADREASRFRDQQEAELNPEGNYRYGEASTRGKLYQEFMNAIDKLAEDDEDAEAWAAVDAWRAYNDHRYEK